MQMIGIAKKPSQSTHQGEGALEAMLQLMADPSKLSETLDELKTQRDQCNAAFDKANAAIKALNDKEAALAKQEAELGEREVVLEQEQERFDGDRKNWATNVAEREAKIVQAKNLLDEAQAKLAADQSNVNAMLEIATNRKTELDKREAALADKEAVARASQAEAQAVIARMEKALRGQ